MSISKRGSNSPVDNDAPLGDSATVGDQFNRFEAGIGAPADDVGKPELEIGIGAPTADTVVPVENAPAGDDTSSGASGGSLEGLGTWESVPELTIADDDDEPNNQKGGGATVDPNSSNPESGNIGVVLPLGTNPDGSHYFTGNRNIDATLIGSKWGTTTLTFSFPTSGTNYNGSVPIYEGVGNYHIDLGTQQQAAARAALAQLSAVSGLTFTEITETDTVHANIRISQTADQDVPSAYGTFPSDKVIASGDIWFGRTSQPYYDLAFKGTWGFATMMHEIGHTMGLKHGHQDYTNLDLSSSFGTSPRFGTQSLTPDRDGQAWSLMTYTPAPFTNSNFAGEKFNQPQTYMQYDLAALQYLYGANFNTNSGDSIYTFSLTTGEMFINGVGQGAPAGNKIFLTIWDGGGNDTIDASNYANGVTIDLRPGEFSTFDQAQLANNLAQQNLVNLAPGNIAMSLLYNNDVRSLIENATGGTGNDVFVGNTANNILDGGAGSDGVVFTHITGVNVTLNDVSADVIVTHDGETDTLRSIENIGGTIGNDTITGNSQDNVLTGGMGGADVLSGGDGSDRLIGGGFTTVNNAIITKPESTANLGTGTAINPQTSNSYTLVSDANITNSTTVPHATINATAAGGGLEYYRLDVTAGATGIFDIDFSSIDTWIELVDSTGTVILANNDDSFTDAGSSTGNSFLSFTFAAAGTYYIRVGRWTVPSDTVAQPLAAGTTYTLHISLSSATINATPFTATNTSSATLDGGEGNDFLQGTLGNDTLTGGNANDTASFATAFSNTATGVTVDLNLQGSAQNTGAAGTDTLTGIENLVGSQYNDTLTGDGNDNFIEGALGNDTLVGGLGNDTASYAGATAGVTVSLALQGSAQNTVNAGTDTLSGFEHLAGSAFNDSLTGDANANTLSGGAGNDTLNPGANAGGIVDLLDGGIGTDTASFAGIASGVTATLNGAVDSTATIAGLAIATLRSIENLTGGSGADSLTGDGNANAIEGGLGNDILDGGLGVDTLVFSGSTAVTVILTTLTAQNTGWGSDTITGFENVRTGSGADNITGDGNDNIFFDGGSNDTYNGAAGSDTVDYSAATSTVTVNLATATAQNTGTSGGTDTITNIENIVGAAAFANTFIGSTLANRLTGGAAVDTIEGRNGADVIFGNAGNDVLLGGTTGALDDGSADTLEGGLGSDYLSGGQGNDILRGGEGNDSLIGGVGNTASQYFTGVDAGDDTYDGGDGTDTAIAVYDGRIGVGASIVGIAFDLRSLAGSSAITFNGVNVGSMTSIETLIFRGTTVDDTVGGTGGFDQLTGGAGNDVLDGWYGNDLLDGGLGNDTLTGGEGLDTATYVNSTAGVNVDLRILVAQNTGGQGIDTLTGIEYLTGSAFGDTLRGDDEFNLIIDAGVGAGATALSQTDSLFGYGGNDSILVTRGTPAANVATNINMDGGDGDDFIELRGGTLSVALAANAAGLSALGTTQGNVTYLVAGATSNDRNIDVVTVDGGAGNDRIILTGVASATINAGSGADLVSISMRGATSVNNYQLTLGSGADIIQLGVGSNAANSTDVAVTARTSRVTDFQVGDTGDKFELTNFLNFGLTGYTANSNAFASGHLRLIQSGSDLLVHIDRDAGGATNSFVTVFAISNGYTGGFTAFNFDGFIGNLNLTGIGVLDETITGATGNDVLSGGDGNDVLIGLAGTDTLDGGNGTDVLDGGTGNDALIGNAGTDTAVYAGVRADYNVVMVTDANGRVTGFTSVTDTNLGNGNEGADTLSGVEVLDFADINLSLVDPVQLFDASGNLVATFTTIQGAIDAAGTNYRIEVGAGTYAEHLTVDVEGLTIEAMPGAVLMGTFLTDNGVTGDLNVWLKTAAAYTGAAGVGVTIAADGVTISGLTISAFLQGILLGNGTDFTTLNDVILSHNFTGIHKPGSAAVTNFTMNDGSIVDGHLGMDIVRDPGSGGIFDIVKIDGTSFADLNRKGIYVEALSHADLLNIVMTNVGEFGGITSTGALGAGGNGINLNLKYGNYTAILIEGFTLTNVGSSDRDGAAASHQNGGAIIITVRDDAPSYSGNPATLTGVIIRDGTIDGTSTGIEVGEPGKNNATPDILVEDVSILNAVHNALHGDVGNQSAATLTLDGTSGGDSLIASGNSDGALIVRGLAGNDTITTGSGADTITGGANDDTLDGAGGYDSAIYGGNRSDYLVTLLSPGVIQVQDLRGGTPDGTDTVTGIEALEFADITMSLAGSVALYDASGILVGTFATIQGAIDAAGTNYRIEVGAGTYAEHLTVDVEGLTIEGMPGAVLMGTFLTDNGVSGDLNVWLKTAAAYTGAAGVGVTIAADGVTISGLTISAFLQGILLGNGTDFTTLNDVILSHNFTGIHKPGSAAVTNFTMNDGSIVDGHLGMDIVRDPGSGGIFDIVKIDGTSFADLNRKGIYVEALSHADLLNIVMTNVGEFGGITSTGALGAGGNGINLNLKYGNYTAILIEGFTLTNVGSSDRDGAAASHQNGGAIIITVRDDAPSYSGNPATLTGVIIRDGTIDGTSTGIEVGEPGKNNATPDVLVEDVSILNAVHNALHGDVGNQSAATLTLDGTSGGDSLIASGNSDGALIVRGLAGNDTITTGSGADTITGGANDDTLDGAGGYDSAIYGGNRSDYLVTLLSPGVIQIQDLRGGTPDGTDTLTRIERIVFADDDYSVEPDGSLTLINFPPVAVDDVNSATEDGAVVSGSVATNDSDPDVGETATLTYAFTGTVPVGLTMTNPNGSYSFDPAQPAYQSLALGATMDVVATYTVTDDHGATDTGTLTVTITGTNDAPVAVADTNSGDAVVESGLNPGNTLFAGDPSAAGNVLVNDTDVDTGDTRTVSAVAGGSVGAPVIGVYGSVVINANGSYFYTLNNADGDTNAIAQGATATEVFTYTIVDLNGATSSTTLTITITGTNDGPVAAADTNSGDAVIEAGVIPGDATAMGNVLANDTDVDTADTRAVSQVNGSGANVGNPIMGTYGSVTIAADGSYTYTLNNADGDTNALVQGATVTEVFTYTMVDANGATSSSTLTITITGTNDAAVIGGDTSANLTEADSAAAISTTGALTVNDPDTGQNAFVAVPGTAGTYGTFAMNGAGAWTYTASSAHNELAAGVTYTDTFTVASVDGTTQVVTINITGTNDGPDAVNDTASATEDGPIVTGNVATNDTDVDIGDTRTYTVFAPVSPVVGFVLHSNGSYSFDASSYDSLAFGATQNVVASYRMTDSQGATDIATLTITVTGVNDGPDAVNDVNSATEDGALVSGTVATNDVDVDVGDTRAYTLNAPVAGLSLALDGSYSFDASSYDSLAFGATQNVVASYTMTDGQGATDIATLTITVTGINDAPDAVNDTVSATEDGPIVTGSVATNDTDIDVGDTRTYTLLGPVTGLILHSNGSYSFDASSYDSLAAGNTITLNTNYRMTDGQGAIDTATLTITITGVNDAPDAVNDIASATEDGAIVNGTVVINDGDPDFGDTRAYTLNAPVVGLTLDIDGNYSFDPSSFDSLAFGATQIVVASYTMTDGSGATDVATLTITVTGVNDAPDAVNDVAGATEDGAVVTGTVATNDTDVDVGDTRTYALSAPVAGLTLDSGGSYSFDPSSYDSLAFGATQIVVATYTMTDGQGTTDTATLTITVTGVNDAPDAVNDMASATEDGAVVTGTVATNDSDVDVGDTRAYALVAPVAGLTLNADGSYSFDPASYDSLAAGATQNVVATYTMIDGQGATDTATLTITVTGVNDAPDAVNDVASATEDGSVVTGSVATNDTDIDAGDTRTYTLAAPVAGLTLDSSGSYSFDPSSYDSLAFGATQIVVATYTMTDGQGATDTATLTITVTGVNDAPDAVNDMASATEDGAVVTGTVATNDSDVDAGDTRAYALVAPVAGLTLNADGSYSFDPASYDTLAAGATQNVVATYTLTDGQGATDTATLTITVTGVNDGPDAVNDVVGATEDGAVVTGSVSTNDTDVDVGDTRTYALNAPVAGLTLDSSGSYSFDPASYDSLAAGATQIVVATYTMTDGQGATDTATLTITVTGVNDGPDAVNDTASATEDGAVVTGTVATNDTDIDAGDTRAYVLNAPVAGLMLAANGSYSFDPASYDSLAAGATQNVVATYTMIDGQGATDTATLTITVTGVNDAPDAVNDVASATEDGSVVTGSVATNDTDIDAGDTRTYTLAAPVAGLTLDSSGSYSFDPASYDSLAAGATQIVVATYTMTDGHGATDTATLTITVTGIDDAPVAQPDSFTTNEATIISGNLLANNGSGPDSDVDGPALSVSAVNGLSANVGVQITLSSGALLTVNANGTFTYDPNHAFDTTPTPGSGASNTLGHDIFTYTLSGGVTATVNITLGGLDSDDILLGTAGADTLNGGTGVDTMSGFGGNDSYYIDNLGDIINEAVGAGSDRLFASVSYTLRAGAEVELMTTDFHSGTAAIDLTGNAFANTIFGNDGDNQLNGGGGADTLVGRLGNDWFFIDNAGDTIVETAGQGNDRLFASVSYTLTAGAEVELMTTDFHAGTVAIDLAGNELANTIFGNDGDNRLNGAAGADTLIGRAGNDILDGGAGIDTTQGGIGNDWHLVDNAGDVVQEAVGEGSDRVFASASYTLTAGAEVELITTDFHSGTAAINLAGNEFANTIYGNAGNNVLDGKGGNDTLVSLSGADTFQFTTALGAGNVDTVFDFVSGTDKIALDDAVFTGLGLGSLPAGAFVTGTAAGDANDRIIYNNATGQLYFDADGNGAGAAILFATLQGAPVLTASDFQVI